jgi:hypothetical protein
LLATFTSAERVFSVARWLCPDYRQTMEQETVSARVMIPVNWELAEPLLQEVLAMSAWGRSRIIEAHVRPEHEAHWRLRVPIQDDPAE